MLSAKYQTGEKLNITMNATVPTKGIKLFKLLKPLLINKMLEHKSNYIALLILIEISLTLNLLSVQLLLVNQTPQFQTPLT
jgi:hypothetical protein